MNIALDEQIKLLSKQLKIPTFAGYHNIQNRADPNSTFGELLLELMRTEYEQRQENNNRRRLKQANFPFTKTIDELDLSRYDGQISDLFISELASCRFTDEKKNLVMIGNPGRGKTHMAIGIGLNSSSSNDAGFCEIKSSIFRFSNICVNFPDSRIGIFKEITIIVLL